MRALVLITRRIPIQKRALALKTVGARSVPVRHSVAEKARGSFIPQLGASCWERVWSWAGRPEPAHRSPLPSFLYEPQAP